MMTLVPALAFAAEPGASAHTSFVEVDKESVDIDEDSVAKFTITVRDNAYQEVGAGVAVYAASHRGAATDKFTKGGKYVDKNVYVGLTDADGKVEFEVAPTVAGEPKFAFSLVYEVNGYTVFDYVADGDGSVAKLGIIEGKVWPVEFVAESGEKVDINKVEIRDRNESENQVVAPTEVDGVVTNLYQAKKWNKANGLDYYEVFVKVTNNSNVPAYDQKVEFSSDKNDCYFSKTSEYTDRNGIASTKVYANKAGVYEITFKVGSKSKTICLVFAPSDVSRIILKSDDNRLLAKDTEPEWKFELQDADGNRIDAAAVTLEDVIEAIDAVDYPTDGEIKSKDWIKEVDEDNDWLVIKPTKPIKKEGTYKNRVTLNNGQYAEFSFQIKEQGTITGLKLEYDQTTLSLGASSGEATVTWVDAAGVEKDADTGINYSASDYNKIDGDIASNGSFKVTKDKDFVGDLIITAFDSTNKLSASFKITIGRELSGIQVVEPADSIAVGETGLVTIKFVDLDGNQVAFGNGEVSLENAYAISKPADAKASVGEGAAFGKGLKENGTATLEVESDKAGDVTFFVNVKAVSNKGQDGEATKYYTATFKVNFGEPKKIAEGAAKKVVMFIGSKGYTQDGEAKLTDVAPFIKDGRTFVAVRPIADAFGVTPENIGWNEATQTVTLVRDDITVTIVIGSNEIEVVKDGVVSIVEADVPAFIADGRTVLPFRAVGDAFGVTTNWDEATQSVTYEQ